VTTTSTDGASIKSIKSFDFKDVRSYNLLKINSQIKLFGRSEAMASFNVESRVQELIALSTQDVGYKEEGVGISARGLQDQVHPGLEAIRKQIFENELGMAPISFLRSLFYDDLLGYSRRRKFRDRDGRCSIGTNNGSFFG